MQKLFAYELHNDQWTGPVKNSRILDLWDIFPELPALRGYLPKILISE